MTTAQPTVSIDISLPFFRQIEQIATERHRSIEDVIQSTFQVALPSFSGLSAEVETELMAMQMMNDDALRAAVGSALSAEKQTRLIQLTDLQDVRHLSYSEDRELEALLSDWDIAALRRTQALAILRQRGFDIHEYIRPSTNG